MLRTVLAVKIDNIVLARPQTGLTQADLVYVLPVEGGLSRFMAIFPRTRPASSARCAAPGRTTCNCCASSAARRSPIPAPSRSC